VHRERASFRRCTVMVPFPNPDGSARAWQCWRSVPTWRRRCCRSCARTCGSGWRAPPLDHRCQRRLRPCDGGAHRRGRRAAPRCGWSDGCDDTAAPWRGTDHPLPLPMPPAPHDASPRPSSVGRCDAGTTPQTAAADVHGMIVARCGRFIPGSPDTEMLRFPASASRQHAYHESHDSFL
jgi:hypothetical protein